MGDGQRGRSNWGAFVREVRKAKGWSQSDLAESLGTDQASVSRWERGIVTPGFGARLQLEGIAADAGRRPLFGLESVVRSSPFPIMVINRAFVVVAASPSMGLVAGKPCNQQVPQADRAALVAFANELTRTGFWSSGAVTAVTYGPEGGPTLAGAVFTPIMVDGESFAIVQRQPVATPAKRNQ